MIKVYLPQLGENIEKATISFWHVKEGASVTEGSDLVEVVTEKAAFNIPAPCSGTLVEILAAEGEEAEVGTVLAVIEEDAAAKEGTQKPA